MTPDTKEQGDTHAADNGLWVRWFWLGVFFFALWLASGFAVWWVFPDWKTRGTFGDMFGGINALFSGIALAGVVIAIIFQRQELRLQRRELEMTRQELRRSSESQLRNLHIELLKLSIEHPELATVWPRDLAPEGEEDFSRYMYVNLILQHMETLHRVGVLDDNGLNLELRHLFESEHFIEFWSRTREFRKKIRETDPSRVSFHEKTDRIYEEARLKRSQL
jgi:hypothetical protein